MQKANVACRVTLVLTDFGEAWVDRYTSHQLGRLNVRGSFDRRFRNAARDERYIRKVQASVRERWTRGDNGPYTYGLLPMPKIMKIARRRGWTFE